MSLQDLGSIGELIAALATVVTLAYLAVQLRRNTRALRSSTFQAMSADVSSSAHAIATNSTLAAIIVKAQRGLAALTPEERVQFNFFQLMLFRRVEAVHMQRVLGSIDPGMITGFERSAISTLATGGGAEWWSESTKKAFTPEFAAHIDAELASGAHLPIHPGFGRN